MFNQFFLCQYLVQRFKYGFALLSGGSIEHTLKNVFWVYLLRKLTH